MGSGGGQQSSTDSSSSRDATTSSTASRNVPSYLKDLMASASSESAVGTSLTGNQNSFLSGLLTKDPSNSAPGTTSIQGLANLDPHDFEGHSTLVGLANRDPYSTGYEAATQDRYDDTVQQGVAASQTGGDRVRGGQAHSALAEGEAVHRAALDRFHEVSGVQRQDAEMQSRAAQILNQIELGRNTLKAGAQNQWAGQYLSGIQQGIEGVKSLDQRRGLNTANLGMTTDMLSDKSSTGTEKAVGTGSQVTSGSGWNAGLNCCFIFLEGLNGELPWFVRKARDMFVTQKRRDGYVRMSHWLVPAMQRHSSVKWLVNTMLIKPFLGWGAWYFGEKPATSTWRFAKPYIFGWFRVWDMLGGR